MRKGELYEVSEDETGTYIFNSKDNCMAEYIPKMMEAGVIGIDLAAYIEDDDKVIIIDAVKSGKNPGEVFILDEKVMQK